MSFLKFLKRCFSSKPQPHEKESLPPYDGPAEREYEDMRQYPKIKATDAPQWKWNRDQCRAWIVQASLYYLCTTIEEAEENAMIYKGMGASIYGLTPSSWKQITGDSASGHSMYALTQLRRKKKRGAAPPGVKFVGSRHCCCGSLRKTGWDERCTLFEGDIKGSHWGKRNREREQTVGVY